MFVVACLPKEGFISFMDICHKYEKGQLKDQRALAKDLKGKPTFKPSYIKCLFGLPVDDRLNLLDQVLHSKFNIYFKLNLAETVQSM